MASEDRTVIVLARQAWLHHVELLTDWMLYGVAGQYVDTVSQIS